MDKEEMASVEVNSLGANALNNKAASVKENEQTRKKKRRRILILLLLLLLLLLGLFWTFFREPPQTTILIGRGTEGFLPGMSPEDLLALMQQEADENMISFRINARPVFESGRGPGSLQVENPPYNLHYMEVNYYLLNADGTLGQQIFATGILPSNHHINMHALDVPLSAGTHVAVAQLIFYHFETMEHISTQQAEVIFTVHTD